MTERVGFIRHKAVEILFIDWSDATADEILQAMADAKTKIALRAPGSVRTLTNVANGRMERRITDALKGYVAHNKPFVLAGAVVGLNDLKMVVFNFINRTTGRTLRAMDSIDEAKEWLASVRA